jgi:hypothetical protein
VVEASTTGAAAGIAGTAASLADGGVKLVAYFIVSVKRDRERVMPNSADTIIVTSTMTDDAFVAYAIGRYLQKPPSAPPTAVREVLEQMVRVLRPLSGTPEHLARLAACDRLIEDERVREAQAALASRQDQLAPGEERFLRVHFTVIRRWPREPLKHGERQQAVLEQIRDEL